MTPLEAADRLETVKGAIQALRYWRRKLRGVKARAAANYMSRALKSVEGAERHAYRLLREAEQRSAHHAK